VAGTRKQKQPAPDEKVQASASRQNAASGTAVGSYPGAQEFIPPVARPSLKALAAAAKSCLGCDLYKRATQVVFGEGGRSATMVLVGEQPGDREDVEGRPFVGPAGALLDKALVDAGIDRKSTYVTNAVKHFKWTPAPRGKKRLHSKPSARQMNACRPWLEEELNAIKPSVLVLLGATAAQSPLGSAFRITNSRGQVIRGTPWAPSVVATNHPSAVLRAPDEEGRQQMYKALVADLRVAARAMLKRPTPAGSRTNESEQGYAR
jgi:DNA polymerase